MPDHNPILKANSSDKPAIWPDRYAVWVCILIVLATLSVYFQVKNFDFVDYDTPEYVYDNSHVKQGLTIANLKWALTTTYMSNWHPLTWMSHMLDVSLFGLAPGPHHLMNLLIHILNTLLLFILFRKMKADVLRSGIVAALFALHPLHVESVAWVAERKDLLSTMFFFLSIISYVHYVTRRRLIGYVAVILCFILGLMAKPMIVTLPFVLLLLDYWPLERFHCSPTTQDGNGSPFSIFIEKIPLLILSAISSVVTLYAQKSGGAIASLDKFSFATRLENALVAYSKYLGKIFWPNHLAVIYPYQERLSGWLVIFSCVCISGISVLAFKSLTSRPWFTFGWLWFLGTLVPVIGIVQVGMQSMADRYTYVPSVGIFTIIAWAYSDLYKSGHNKRRMVAMAVSTLFVYAAVAYKQVGYWHDSQALFEHAINVTQNNFIAQNNLGYQLLEKDDLAKAIWHFNKAIKIDPDFEIAHLNLGLALSRKGNIDGAIAQYRIALKIKPDYAEAYNNLGNSDFRQGKYKQAGYFYFQALRWKPEFSEAYSNLGAVMVRLGDKKKALQLFRKALKIDSGNKNAYQNMQAILSTEE